MKVPIEISARHIHLSRHDLDILFGQDYKLTEYKKISQLSQFSAQETVSVKGLKQTLENVRIVGPIRLQTQLELSRTDAYNLGIDPLIRVSGDLKGTTGGVIIIGPNGQIGLSSGVIIAQRHLHIEPELAEKLNLKHNQIISIKTSGQRSIVFNEVVIRSRQDQDSLALHLDTDEANAAGVKNGENISF